MTAPCVDCGAVVPRRDMIECLTMDPTVPGVLRCPDCAWAPYGGAAAVRALLATRRAASLPDLMADRLASPHAGWPFDGETLWGS